MKEFNTQAFENIPIIRQLNIQRENAGPLNCKYLKRCIPVNPKHKAPLLITCTQVPTKQNHYHFKNFLLNHFSLLFLLFKCLVSHILWKRYFKLEYFTEFKLFLYTIHCVSTMCSVLHIQWEFGLLVRPLHPSLSIETNFNWMGWHGTESHGSRWTVNRQLWKTVHGYLKRIH
jgi:hypothetical protein